MFNITNIFFFFFYPSTGADAFLKMWGTETVKTNTFSAYVGTDYFQKGGCTTLSTNHAYCTLEISSLIKATSSEITIQEADGFVSLNQKVLVMGYSSSFDCYIGESAFGTQLALGGTMSSTNLACTLLSWSTLIPAN